VSIMLNYRQHRNRVTDHLGLPNTAGLPNTPGLPQDGGLPGSHSRQFKKQMKLFKKLHIRPTDPIDDPNDDPNNGPNDGPNLESKSERDWADLGGIGFGDTTQDQDITKALYMEDKNYLETYQTKSSKYVKDALIPNLKRIMGNKSTGYKDTWDKHPQLKKRMGNFISELQKVGGKRNEEYNVDNIFA
jgi:hypothetical protein